jgi:hypothetical protein
VINSTVSLSRRPQHTITSLFVPKGTPRPKNPVWTPPIPWEKDSCLPTKISTDPHSNSKRGLRNDSPATVWSYGGMISRGKEKNSEKFYPNVTSSTTNITFFPEGGVGLVPKRGCLLTLAYYAFPRRYGFGERRWNDILTGENRKTRRKTCPSATLSTTNLTWIDQCANPGLRGERPATNDLSHGTAHEYRLVARISPGS